MKKAQALAQEEFAAAGAADVPADWWPALDVLGDFLSTRDGDAKALPRFRDCVLLACTGARLRKAPTDAAKSCADRLAVLREAILSFAEISFSYNADFLVAKTRDALEHAERACRAAGAEDAAKAVGRVQPLLADPDFWDAIHDSDKHKHVYPALAKALVKLSSVQLPQKKK